MRTVGGRDFLLGKFAWRKNMKHGCILRRPRLRHDSMPLAMAIFPVHLVWPRISDRVPTGDFLSPSFSAGKFRTNLRSNMADAGYEYGSIFSPRCFRRGATQELKVDRSGDTQIKGAGRWGAMGIQSLFGYATN